MRYGQLYLSSELIDTCSVIERDGSHREGVEISNGKMKDDLEKLLSFSRINIL